MSVADPLSSYQALRQQQVQQLDEPDAALKPSLWVDAGGWQEALIPPRPWIVPGHIMRGTVTLLAGPGGAGKSALMVGWAIAMSQGVPFGSFEPAMAARVLIYNVEDDKDEQQRRLSAALRPTGRSPHSVEGRIIRCGPTGVGTLLERDALLGSMISTAALNGLRDVIQHHRPDVVMMDPLAELHTSEENDNTALRLVIAHLREIARTYNIGVVLVHHTRKGAVAGEADDIRGGGAIVGAVRTAFTVMSMSAEEAEELGIDKANRRRFIRLDSAKGNYAPPREAAWHELQDYELDNGEMVAAAVPWERPRTASETSPEAMALIEAELARGTAGGPYSPRLAHDQPRSVAALLAQHGITTTASQKKLLKELSAKGWQVLRFRDAHRDIRTGIRSPEGLPHAKWDDQ